MIIRSSPFARVVHADPRSSLPAFLVGGRYGVIYGSDDGMTWRTVWEGDRGIFNTYCVGTPGNQLWVGSIEGSGSPWRFVLRRVDRGQAPLVSDHARLIDTSNLYPASPASPIAIDPLGLVFAVIVRRLASVTGDQMHLFRLDFSGRTSLISSTNLAPDAILDFDVGYHWIDRATGQAGVFCTLYPSPQAGTSALQIRSLGGGVWGTSKIKTGIYDGTSDGTSVDNYLVLPIRHRRALIQHHHNGGGVTSAQYFQYDAVTGAEEDYASWRYQSGAGSWEVNQHKPAVDIRTVSARSGASVSFFGAVTGSFPGTFAPITTGWGVGTGLPAPNVTGPAGVQWTDVAYSERKGLWLFTGQNAAGKQVYAPTRTPSDPASLTSIKEGPSFYASTNSFFGR